MATEKGVWNVQEVRDKQLLGEWSYDGAGQLWTTGWNIYGALGLNQAGPSIQISSPTQVPGTNWYEVSYPKQYGRALGMKTDGSVWGWGAGADGNLGLNEGSTQRSSPVQIMAGPGSVGALQAATLTSMVSDSDGNLWMWGENNQGQLGHNQPDNKKVSSPIQIPGTWSKNISLSVSVAGGVKTDGTLWLWGLQSNGTLGQNETYNPSKKHRSSPSQVGSSSDWSTSRGGLSISSGVMALKTNGTLWMWGYGGNGGLGQNDKTSRSSPVQIPGTTWAWVGNFGGSSSAIKTNGTFWSWGYNNAGMLGHNNQTEYSSPKQVGTNTNWSKSWQNELTSAAIKTDGTAWTWGAAGRGQQGHNDTTQYSSPKQVPGTYSWLSIANYQGGFIR